MVGRNKEGRHHHRVKLAEEFMCKIKWCAETKRVDIIIESRWQKSSCVNTKWCIETKRVDTITVKMGEEFLCKWWVETKRVDIIIEPKWQRSFV